MSSSRGSSPQGELSYSIVADVQNALIAYALVTAKLDNSEFDEDFDQPETGIRKIVADQGDCAQQFAARGDSWSAIDRSCNAVTHPESDAQKAPRKERGTSEPMAMR